MNQSVYFITGLIIITVCIYQLIKSREKEKPEQDQADIKAQAETLQVEKAETAQHRAERETAENIADFVNSYSSKDLQDAYKAICSSYTKILKINLTEDSYTVISLEVNDRERLNLPDRKISTWLYKFGISGDVHRDDVKQYLHHTDIGYLQDYFSQGKTSIHIFYKRKMGDVYRQVLMEIDRADNYSDDDQNLYLYVKDIDQR